ncbi:MAG: PAS domain S-box protein [Planctomycetota bacterium]
MSRDESALIANFEGRVLESMTEGVNLADENGLIVYTNPSADAMLGYEAGELVGQPLLILSGYPNDENERICNEVLTALQTKGTWIGEWVNRRKDGTLFETSTRIATVAAPGDRYYYLCVQQDISERKSAEAQRDRLWNLSLDPMCVAGFDGYLKQVNPAWSKTLGWLDAELLSRPWIDFVHADDREASRRANETLASGKPVLGLENRFRCVSGGHRWFSWNAYPNLETNSILAVIRDSTQAHRSDEALRESEDRYRSLVDSAPVAIWEEDFTAVEAWFESLRSQGVRDLRSYFLAHPEAGRAALELVRIRRINQEAVIQNGAASKQDLLARVHRIFTERSYAVWSEELVMLWEGRRLMEFETVAHRLDGAEAHLLMRLHVPGSPEAPRWDQVIVTGTDITARRQAERELQQSQTRLEAAQRQAKLGVWDYTPLDGRIWWSDELYRLFGKSADSFAPSLEGFLACVPAEERSFIRSSIEHSLVHNAPYRLQHRIIRANGESAWIEAAGAVERDAQGRTVRLWGTSQDITERKTAQEKLLTSEALLNATGAMAKVGGWELDVRSATLRWTNVTFRIHELPAGKEPALADAYSFFPLDERPRIEAFMRAAQERAEPFDEEFRFITGRGSPRWVHILCTPQVRGGVVARLVGTLQDITSRKRGEELLRESDERYRLAIRATNDGIYDMDLATRTAYCSDHYVSAFGQPPEPAQFWSWWAKRIHSEDRDRAVKSLRAAIKGAASSWDCEYRFLLPKGTWADIIDRASIARDGLGKARRVVGAMQDITARKEAEARREQLESRMRDAQKLESLGVLAGGIAHDFNNLLTTILGYADLASDQLPRTSPAQAYLQKIERSSRRAADLCQQMLAYAGKGKVLVGPIDLGELIREANDLLRLSFSKKARLQLELVEKLPAIEADASQIRQVVMNLAMNAAEAVGEESGQVKLATGVKQFLREELDAMLLGDACSEGRYVWLDVVDNGCGIRAEDLGRIFEPFYSTKFTGRGLGLAAVLGIVRGHGGALRVVSERDKGTSFRIVFPALHISAPTSETETVVTWRGRGAVLVADDELNVRKMSKTMLESLGFAVYEASNGREAMEHFSQGANGFVAALLDLTMPGKSGHTVFVELSQLVPELPIVVMSGYPEAEVERLFSNLRPAAFLQKPFAKGDLAKKLRRALETHIDS